MKRFIEDYDPEVHENFPCFSRGENGSVQGTEQSGAVQEGSPDTESIS